MGTWEHKAILEGNKGTRTPLGDPQAWRLLIFSDFYENFTLPLLNMLQTKKELGHGLCKENSG